MTLTVCFEGYGVDPIRIIKL